MRTLSTHNFRLPALLELLRRRKHESAVVLGVAVTVCRGTVRRTPDYDDAWFAACACHSNIILDVGANIGQEALLALVARPESEVFLVEANPEALLIAAENLILNNLIHRTRLTCAFAGDSDDNTIAFWTIGAGAAGSIFPGHAASAARLHRSISARTVTLDRIARDYAIVPDLVKIDVEGAETLVLNGCMEIAAHMRTRFLVELHSPPELPMRVNAERVLGWATRCNYQPWYLKNHSLLSSPDEVADRGRCHLLLQPRGWPYPKWLARIPQGAPPEIVLTEENAC